MKNTEMSLSNEKGVGNTLRRKAAESLINITERACGKCTFAFFHEVEIPIEILKDEYEKIMK